jgi:hypothetical protein
MRAARVVPAQVSKVSNVSEHIYVPFKEHLKRLALPTWEEFHDLYFHEMKTSLLIGCSLPPQ